MKNDEQDTQSLTKKEIKENKTEKNAIVSTKYSKEQIIKSKKYSLKADLINTILSDDKDYTLKEVEEALDKALKARVI